MKILNRYVIKNITLNKRRTLSIGIAVALSTALICSVLVIAINFYLNSLNNTISTKGNYHTIFTDVKNNESKFITNNSEISDYFVTQEAGYIDLDNSKGKDFISLLEFDDKAINNSGLQLVEGRMPQNSNELVISDQIESYGEVKLKIGETFNFQVNKLLIDGEYELKQGTTYLKSMLTQMRITREPLYHKKYTIVGIIKRPDTGIEPYNAAGYTAITILDNKEDTSSYWVSYGNIDQTFDITKKLSEANRCAYRINYDLLSWYGVSEGFNFVFMGAVIVMSVIVVIMICSILAVKSSFIISISEKVKQYGILSSIGAKRSQIKKIAMKENLIISSVSITTGIGLGIGLAFILIQISKSLLMNTMLNIFYVPLWIVTISVIFSIITVYFSSRSAFKKLKDISPINSIRATDDIKIDKKNITTPKFIKKYFGIGGVVAYKNIKRNKKKYEATVISLIISITLFIGLNSFISYSNEISNNFYQDRKYNVIIGYKSYEDESEKYRTLSKIVNLPEIKSYMLGRYKIGWFDLSNYVSTNNIELYKSICTRDNMVSCNIEVLGKQEYERFVAEIGENYNECKNGIIYVKGIRDYVSDKNKNKVQLLNLQKGDTMKGITQEDDINLNLKVVATTNKSPMGYENMATPIGRFIMSDELFDKLFNEFRVVYIAADCDEPDNVCKSILSSYDNILAKNMEEEIQRENQTKLLISILLYGVMFIVTLIAITNIFNIIITNIYLRKKEFAMLKSIGMTKKEFTRMINLESVLYCTESIMIGSILGTVVSSIVYYITSQIDTVSFKIPITSILIACFFVLIVVKLIMRYGIKKIGYDNIIDTIKNDNI